MLNLQGDTERSLSGSNELLQSIGRAQRELLNISRNFSTALNISRMINEIELPSDEAVSRLADRIRSNVVPDELVVEVMTNASLSAEIARNALDLAQNARQEYFFLFLKLPLLH